ncbi:MAG: flagellar biosynthesis protein FlhF [Wenzhouxiangellaceae bacterium]|nr:flagellar biosynthesis protein FlhF [Wenzhouxiangellaceae bacterium]
MNIKRFVASDMRQALRQIREELGLDAVILSSRQTAGGLEVVAAIDYDEHLVDSAFHSSEPDTNASDDGSGKESPRFVDRLRRRRMGEDTVGLPGRNGKTAASPKPGSTLELLAQRQRQDSERALDDGQPPRAAARDIDAPESRRSRPAPIAADPRPQPVRMANSPADAALDELGARREATMQAEINALRRMLEGQLSRLAWHDFSRRSPLRAALLRDLLEMGLSAPLAQEVAANVADSGDLARAWRESLGQLAQRIPIDNSDPLREGGVIALVGPTGAGKTTTIAKLAARYADRHGPENVAVITADDYRVGAQEQLFIYGRSLNIPIYAASTADELHYRIEKLQQGRLVLVDTAGSGYRDQEFARLSEIIKSVPAPLLPYVVLPANAQLQSLRETLSAFSSLPLAGVVVTKLDEAARLGGLVSALIESGLPVTWSSDGREVPEHLRRASARNLVRLAAGRMPGAERETIDEDVMAQQIGPMEFAFG